MKKSSLLMSLVLPIAIAACTPTPTTRTAGETVDDAALTARVKTAIAQYEGVGEAAKINVDSYRGVVQLQGFVDSQDQADTVGRAASRVPGVGQVVNNLQVKPR